LITGKIGWLVSEILVMIASFTGNPQELVLCSTEGLNHSALIEFGIVHCALCSGTNYNVKCEHVTV
jgi:hypothetical protein